MNNLYNEKSIESLDPLTFTRLKPGVYAGDTTYATQLLIEILSNAVDEYRLGNGDLIEVIINEDVVTVIDYGQGFIPNSIREDGKTILEASFSVLNTSGKYREDGAYEGTSLGSFGIGSKITTFLSHWLEVITTRDGQMEEIIFTEGVFDRRKTGEVPKDMHGTVVTWQPSEEFFTHTEVEINVIKTLFKTIACLCPGLTIKLNHNGAEISYHSEKGLHDLVEEAVADKEILKNRLSINAVDGKNKLDLVMTYTSNYSSTIVPYVNTGFTESGPHITQIKTTLTREFNKFFREKKWLKEKDDNLTGDDIQEGIYLVFNITAPNVSYDAQVKNRVTKIDMKPFIQIFIENLQDWFIKNEKEIKVIADKALGARKAREAAKKAREAVRGNKKKKEKVLKFDSKLADCYSKDRKKCEIYLTEGDSASGNLKLARNNEFQAVMPLRGKILNYRKATLDKIQKNAEIMSMIDAFGLEVDLKTMKLVYDPSKLRYGKIIFAVDADLDGSHIASLLATFIWTFCPQLILDGYVYVLVPPLYKMTVNKEYYYLKDDNELEEYRQKFKGKKYTLARNKGLGEMDADETEETLINVNNRVIKQLVVDDVKETDKMFDILMGNCLIERKEFVRRYSKEAKYDV